MFMLRTVPDEAAWTTLPCAGTSGHAVRSVHTLFFSARSSASRLSHTVQPAKSASCHPAPAPQFLQVTTRVLTGGQRSRRRALHCTAGYP